MNASAQILLGLGLGLGGGILFSLTEPPLLSELPVWIAPIGELWINGIRMTVVPMLMALLITAVAGQPSSSAVANLSGKTLALLVALITVAALFTLLLAPPLLALVHIDPAASRTLLESTGLTAIGVNQLPPFSDWFVGLLPANPIRAAADTAILPLLIFTGLFAIALLHISPDSRAHVVAFFQAIKDVMFVLIGWVMKLAPVGIFALIFPLAATLGLAAITVLGSFIFITSSLIVVLTLLLYLLVAVASRVPISEFARALAPVQIIGFSSRSSQAALPATYAATAELGVAPRIAGLVLPIAVTLFKFASPVGRITGTYFIANLYGIELEFTAMVIIAAAIGLFSFYSPGIPSGGLLIMAPVYLALGLPVAGIGLLIAVDLIVDMFITASNVTANVAVAVLISKAAN